MRQAIPEPTNKNTNKNKKIEPKRLFLGLSALIFYFLFNAEFNKIPNDFAMRVAQGIRLSDEEKKELKDYLLIWILNKRNHKAPKWCIKIGAVGDFIQLCQLTNAHQPLPQRILYSIDLIIAL